MSKPRRGERTILTHTPRVRFSRLRKPFMKPALETRVSRLNSSTMRRLTALSLGYQAHQVPRHAVSRMPRHSTLVEIIS